MKLLASILAVAASLLTGWACAGEANIASGGKALAVYQRVGLSTDGYPVDVTAKSGTLRVVDGVMTISGDAVALPGGIVGALPYIPYTTPLRTQLQWIQTGNYWFPFQYHNMLKAGILPYMADHGYTTAMFDYGQRVVVAASPAPRIKWLSWRVLIDSTGRERYADVKLLDEAPQTLYVSYTPKKVAEGLPNGFAYPDAGKIKWNMMDSSGNAISAITTIDVNGAYDEPTAQVDAPDPLPAGCTRNPDDGQVACDPDYGLKCLINNQSDPGCPTAYKDVRQLIEDTAPAATIVDYTRKVQPIYEDVDNGDGTSTSVAKTAVSIDTRTWKAGRPFFFISPAGGTTFSETGSYGFELLLQTERYRVDNDLSYMNLGIKQKVVMSPSQSFAKTVVPPPGAICAAYTYKIIDPYETNEVYDWRYDTVNHLPPEKYTYVAPLACY